MNKNNYLKTAAFFAMCILLNIGGKYLSILLSLPVWLDSFGTALTAYGFGPVCGAVVGFAGNVIYGMSDGVSHIYSITSIVIGIVIGLSARKGRFETILGTMTASMLVTLSSIVVSVPLNLLFYEGMTGNVWGDGVIGFLGDHGIPRLLSAVVGEFYVDFLDKVTALMVLFGVIKLRRRLKNGRMEQHKAQHSAAAKVTALFVCGASVLAVLNTGASAAGNGGSDYNGYVRTVYSSDNGLPCGEANDIVQTKDGILWVGTYAGLYRYNGSEFRWTDFESVRNVNCLFVDEEGRLWIGTNDNGVSISINESIANVIDKDDGLPSDSVRCITQTADGNYYIGTTESMAVLTLNNGLRLLNVIPQVHYAVTLTADKDGHAAAVSADGMLFLLGNGEILTSKEISGSDDIYTCCTFGEDGTLYAGTSGDRIFVYELSDGSLVQKKTITTSGISSIQSVNFIGSGLGIVCADSGVGAIDENGGFTRINTDEFNNSIDNMTVDYQGNLWFTSSRLGLLRLSQSVFTDIYRKYGLTGKVVNSTEEWNGCLYFGTDNGLDVADMSAVSPLTNELTEMLDGVRIRCVRRDSRNDLWLCTYGKGLLKVSADGKVEIYDGSNGSFGNRARTIMEMSDGTMVAAGDTGMTFIGQSGILRTISYGDKLSNAMILSLLETDAGALLAGTDGDGIAVIKNGEVVRTLTRYDGLSSGVILRMTKCTDGEHILIVTSNGLCCMDGDYNIHTLENFPYFNNYDIWTSESGRLFVLSSAGIYVADEKDVINDKPEMRCEILDAKSGLNASLTANSWNYCDSDGDLYLSADTGVYTVNTSDYAVQRRSYRMLVTSVKLDGTAYPVERGETFEIARDVGRIEIFPEVINYTIEDPYVSYYLEGFDDEPTIVSQSALTSVTYTNLPSGSYTFHIAVLDRDLNDTLEESSYSFLKNREIYDNDWFIVYMLVVAMIAVAWLTWFIAKSQIQRTLLIQQKQLELAEKQVQMGNETILAIARTVDAKDENTSQHSQRVSEYAVKIAEQLGFSKEERENLRKAALLHDIGKIGIPDRILNKPSRLTDEEYAIMKTHVTRGGEILKDFTLIENVVDGALYHHERYDGTGYASGLKGEEIPIYGRIIGVADAFDAMTANRVYRKKLDIDFVMGELERCKGTQFDPVMADIMINLVKNGKIDIESIYGKETEQK